MLHIWIRGLMLVRLLVPLSLVATLAGCGYADEDFRTESVEAACALTFECISGEELESALRAGFWLHGATASECETMYDRVMDVDDGCVYDSEQAELCIAALNSATCDDVDDRGFVAPSACDTVCG